MKVLIIDDDADIRRIATLSLRDLGGFEVLEAATAADGLRQARDAQPHAILLDLGLSDADGADVLSELSAGPLTGGIPVVVLTASAERAREDARIRESACGLIVKPFHPAELPQKLRALVEAQATRAGTS